MVITPTATMTTRMKLNVSTYPSKRLSRTVGYGVQGGCAGGGSTSRFTCTKNRRLAACAGLETIR